MENSFSEHNPLGPISAEIISRADKLSASNYAPYPFVVEKTEGAFLYDPDGNQALDLLSAYSAVLNHRHPAIIKAVEDEIKNGADIVSRALYTSKFADFVELVTKLTGYDRVLPKSDGGSATDSAIKTLLMHGSKKGIEKPEIILTKDYFHGRSLVFASSADFDPEQSHLLKQRMPGIIVVDHTADAIREAINENTIGIFVETHKGEGGPLFTPKKEFIKMREIAREKKIFFGVDEIQTGLGRCGYIMAWQEFGEKARPDFVTLGKALGGGVIPVSALVGTEEFMSICTPGTDGSTFGGYPLACAAAIASLKVIVKENIPEKSKELGDYFAKRLKEEIPGIGVEHRGLLMRIELPGVVTAKPLCKEMLLGKDREFRVFMKHGHETPQVAYARIAPPPGAITKELIDEAIEKTIAPVLKKALQKL